MVLIFGYTATVAIQKYSKTQACAFGCWNFCMTSIVRLLTFRGSRCSTLFDMTMQTPSLSAFAKPFAIFFFSISNLVAP